MISKHIQKFLEARKENDRYSSFDYCYNYFYSFYKNNEIDKIGDKDNIEKAVYNYDFI